MPSASSTRSAGGPPSSSAWQADPATGHPTPHGGRAAGAVGAVLRGGAGRGGCVKRETSYKGYRIEGTSYEVLEEPSGWVAAAVVWWSRGGGDLHEVIFDRGEPRRYSSRDEADAHA